MAQDNRKYRKRGESNSITEAATEVGRVPPQAVDIEEAVLGSMMIEPDCVADAIEVLSPRSFYKPGHRRIYEAIIALYNEKSAIDMLTVHERLKRNGTLEEAGGTTGLADITNKVGAAMHFEYHVRILQEKTIQRDLIAASYEILNEAFSERTDMNHLIETSQTKIFNAVQGNLKSDYLHVGEIVNMSLDRIQSVQGSHGITGIPSGYPSLDSITMGWQKSNLVIIGARPSMGKTAFALNIARNAAVKFKIPTAFFSLEMSSVEITDRLITSESGVGSDKIKGRTNMSAEDWDRMEKTIKDLVSSPLYIDETPAITITEFTSKAKRLKREVGVELIIVDYLQLMHAGTDRQMHREQEVSAISQALKSVAKELKITVIALSQLNRNLMSRAGTNGRPTLSDLRDSGSIEQDADMVLFVHRPGMLGLEYDKSEAEIIIAKHRNGRTENIGMRYDGDRFLFLEDSGGLSEMVSFDQSHIPQGGYELPDSGPAQYSPFDDFGGSGFNNNF